MPAQKAITARDEAGFTLVEVLVALAVALALLVPTVAVVTTVQNHSAGAITRADTVQTASAALRNMDQELRQAYAIQFPIASTSSGCVETGGVQGCNQLDVLARLSGTGFSGSEFELRYDCSVASTTIQGDRACWRYLCSASATTAATATCTASSTTLLSSRLVADDLVNGTSADPVFSLCYPSATGTGCGAGAARATSATVTLKLPSTPGQSATSGGDPSTVVLTDGLYFPNLDYAQ